MLRILYRTLLILLAAGAIAGGAYLYSQSSAAGQTGEGPQQREGMTPPQGETQAFPQDTTSSGELVGDFGRGGHDEDSASFSRGMTTLGKNLGILAGVAAGFVLVEQTLGYFQRRRRPTAAG